MNQLHFCNELALNFDVEEEINRENSITSEKTAHVRGKAKVSPFSDIMDEYTSNSRMEDINRDNELQTRSFASESSEPYCITSSTEDISEVNEKSNPIDWQSVKTSGLDDLEKEKLTSGKVQRKELLSHVPTETVVMKYGYVRSFTCKNCFG